MSLRYSIGQLVPPLLTLNYPKCRPLHTLKKVFPASKVKKWSNLRQNYLFSDPSIAFYYYISKSVLSIQVRCIHITYIDNIPKCNKRFRSV